MGTFFYKCSYVCIFCEVQNKFSTKTTRISHAFRNISNFVNLDVVCTDLWLCISSLWGMDFFSFYGKNSGIHIYCFYVFFMRQILNITLVEITLSLYLKYRLYKVKLVWSGTISGSHPVKLVWSGTVSSSHPVKLVWSGTVSSSHPVKLVWSGTVSSSHPEKLLWSGIVSSSHPWLTL